MKNIKFISVLLISILYLSCKKDTPNNQLRIVDSTQVTHSFDSLELTFINTNLSHNFLGICFVDENVGYLCGWDGALSKTTNGGESWIDLNSNTTLPLYDVYFFNANEGFVVGGEKNCGGTGCTPRGAIILHTTDGGLTWNQASFSTEIPIELRSVCFVNEDQGYAVGTGSILKTNNRGASWQETRFTNTGGIMHDIEFAGTNNGLIGCTFGRLFKTTNGGQSWTLSNPFPSFGANTLAVVNDNLVYSAGYSTIHKSTDFGNTWIELPSHPLDIYKLVFKTADIGYAFGRGQYSGGDFGTNYGSIYYTEDGGNTWSGCDTIHQIGLIEAASFPLTNIGYAVSNYTVIKIKRK